MAQTITKRFLIEVSDRVGGRRRAHTKSIFRKKKLKIETLSQLNADLP